MTLFGLDNRVVVLTGASSGLGARWAPVLAAAGARVVLTARREAELARVASDIPDSLVLPGDITSDTDRHRLIDETLRTFGRIDVLVNCAGTAVSSPAVDTPVEEFRTMIETDLTAVFALTAAWHPNGDHSGSESTP